MKTLLAVALLTTMPSLATAQAACPVAADLDRGIRITFTDGGTETYRNGGVGLVSVTGRDTDGTGFEMELGRGVHLMYWEGIEDGALSGFPARYDYAGVGASDLPLPRPGKGWRSEVTLTNADGSRPEAQTHLYGPVSTVLIGDCQYDMIEVVVVYDSADNYQETLRYLPELGLAYLVWNQAEGMEPRPAEATGILRAGK